MAEFGNFSHVSLLSVSHLNMETVWCFNCQRNCVFLTSFSTFYKQRFILVDGKIDSSVKTQSPMSVELPAQVSLAAVWTASDGDVREDCWAGVRPGVCASLLHCCSSGRERWGSHLDAAASRQDCSGQGRPACRCWHATAKTPKSFLEPYSS